MLLCCGAPLYRTCRSSPATTLAAGDAADESVEYHCDAAHDGMEDAGDGVDNGCQAVSDGGEDALDL